LIHYEKWNTLDADSLLDVGNPEVFGGIRVVRGRGKIVLPDGRCEPMDYARTFGYDRLWFALNSPHVWAWFNAVREEERFKAYLVRAKALLDGT